MVRLLSITEDILRLRVQFWILVSLHLSFRLAEGVLHGVHVEALVVITTLYPELDFKVGFHLSCLRGEINWRTFEDIERKYLYSCVNVLSSFAVVKLMLDSQLKLATILA